MGRISTYLTALAVGLCYLPGAWSKGIVHDAEFYVLQSKYKETWKEEDAEINEKLEALKEKFGTTPNIIHIMWDDSAVGDIGIPHIQKIRGYSTPHMNQLADEGLNMMRMYTEPSCTPSRAAVLTGRHAIRSGMYNVGFPYEYGGLGKDEVTQAEVLSEAGYATAFYGKWHLGDIEESYATRQGFDEAIWTPYNQVPSMYTVQAETMGAISGMYPESMPADPYDKDTGWSPKGFVNALEGTKGGEVNEFGRAPDLADYLKIESESQKRTLAFINKNAKAKKPFYVAYWPQMVILPGFPDRVTANRGFLPEALQRFDPFVGQLKEELIKLGIAENTLVILMADNGPFTHNGPPGSTETLYTGGKGDFTEGGLRVPAIAWWPGMIQKGGISADIVHETDLFTTFARIAGATKYIPRDRIIDGVDQTSLLVNGDTFSRRDYNFVYTGNIHAATIKGRYKRKWVGELPGLSGAAFYDLYQDPREASPQMLTFFPTKGMFNVMKARHELWKEKYPDSEMTRGMPLTGIANARPETRQASKPRVDPKDLPFDPEEFLEATGGWEDIDRDWGTNE